MARQKRLRFARLSGMPNVVDPRVSGPGWFDAAIEPQAPVLLELGCGHGDYLLERARREPKRRFLGVDRNGARLWKGARQALDEGLANVVFLRSTVEALDGHLPPRRAGEIWILFPDPLPKRHQAKHRLVSPAFLERYRRLLAPGGTVRLRTDSTALTAFAEGAVRAGGGRVVALDQPGEPGDVPGGATRYEHRYRQAGRLIHERAFRFD
jgi:tRNA (guanine-N7-)-methyltransferase